MIGCVTQEAQAAMEKARQEREGLTGPAFTGKGRKRREREERARMPASDAHHAAEGALGHIADDGDEDCVPATATADMGKTAYEHIGIADGPASAEMPGQISPHEFARGYLQAGHGALSPSAGPPNTPHVDLRGDRGMVRPLSPSAPIPVEGPDHR